MRLSRDWSSPAFLLILLLAHWKSNDGDLELPRDSDSDTSSGVWRTMFAGSMGATKRQVWPMISASGPAWLAWCLPPLLLHRSLPTSPLMLPVPNQVSARSCLRKGTQEDETGKGQLQVLSRQDGFLVINKQCGQRMDGNFEGTIEKLVLQLTDVVKFRPIHQLDFATSGVLVLGLDKASAARARRAFDSGRVRKCYLALVEGIMEKREVWVKEPIAMYQGDATLPPRGDEGTHSGARDFRMMVGHGGPGNKGKDAVTKMVCLGTGSIGGQDISKVAMFPYTGRRHQLRLHAAHIGHGILGDWTYGNKSVAQSLPRMYLHAWKLEMAAADTEKGKEKEKEKERDFEQKGELARGNTATDCKTANTPPFTLRWTAPDPFAPESGLFDSFISAPLSLEDEELWIKDF